MLLLAYPEDVQSGGDVDVKVLKEAADVGGGVENLHIAVRQNDAVQIVSEREQQAVQLLTDAA